MDFAHWWNYFMSLIFLQVKLEVVIRSLCFQITPIWLTNEKFTFTLIDIMSLVCKLFLHRHNLTFNKIGYEGFLGIVLDIFSIFCKNCWICLTCKLILFNLKRQQIKDLMHMIIYLVYLFWLSITLVQSKFPTIILVGV